MGYYVNYEVHNKRLWCTPNRERIYLLCRHAKLLEELGQKQETDYLKANYNRVSVSTLAEQLGRSQKATRNQLERMGIRLSTRKKSTKA